MRLVIFLFLLIAPPLANAFQYSPSEATLADVRGEQRAEADLQAQQDMAEYAAWAVCAAAVSGAIGVLTLLALWGSLKQTENAISLSRETEKSTQERDQASIRAYVHVDKVTFGQGSRPILYCKNTGSTPAKFFAVGVDIKKVPYGKISQSAVLGNYEMKAWPALGGNSQLTVNAEPTLGEELLEEYARQRFDPSECLVVVGRIVYADIFDRKFETGFAFYTNYRRGGTFGRPVSNLPAFRELSANEWVAIFGQPVAVETGKN